MAFTSPGMVIKQHDKSKTALEVRHGEALGRLHRSGVQVPVEPVPHFWSFYPSSKADSSRGELVSHDVCVCVCGLLLLLLLLLVLLLLVLVLLSVVCWLWSVVC